MEQEKKLCEEVERVREFIYQGDRVSVGGVCEAVVTASVRCEWVISMECVSYCMKCFFLKVMGAM